MLSYRFLKNGLGEVSELKGKKELQTGAQRLGDFLSSYG